MQTTFVAKLTETKEILINLSPMDRVKKLIDEKKSPIDSLKILLSEYKQKNATAGGNAHRLLSSADNDPRGINFCKQLLTKNFMEEVIGLLNKNADQLQKNTNLCQWLSAFFFYFPQRHSLLSKKLQALLPLENICQVAYPPFPLEKRILENIVSQLKNPNFNPKILFDNNNDCFMELIVNMEPGMRIQCFYALINSEKISTQYNQFPDYLVDIFSLLEEEDKIQVIKTLKEPLAKLPLLEAKFATWDELEKGLLQEKALKKRDVIRLFFAKALAHIPIAVDQTEFLHQEIRDEFTCLRKLSNEYQRSNYFEERIRDLLIPFLKSIHSIKRKTIDIHELIKDIAEGMHCCTEHLQSYGLVENILNLLDSTGYDGFEAFDFTLKYGGHFKSHSVTLQCNRWTINKMQTMSSEQKTIMTEKYLALFEKDYEIMLSASDNLPYLLTKLDHQHNKMLYAWVLKCRQEGKDKPIKQTILYILDHIFKSGYGLSQQDADEMMDYVNYLQPTCDGREYNYDVIPSVASKVSPQFAMKVWSAVDQKQEGFLHQELAAIFKSLEPTQQEIELKKWLATPTGFFANIIIHIVDIKTAAPDLLERIIKVFDVLVMDQKLGSQRAMELLAHWLKPELPQKQQSQILGMLLRYRKTALESKNYFNVLGPLGYLKLSRELLNNINVEHPEEMADQVVNIMLMKPDAYSKSTYLAILNACLKKLHPEKVVEITQWLSSAFFSDETTIKTPVNYEIYMSLFTVLLPYLPKALMIEAKDHTQDSAIYSCDDLVQLAVKNYLSFSRKHDDVDENSERFLLSSLAHVSLACVKTIFNALHISDRTFFSTLSLDDREEVCCFIMFIPAFKAMKKAGQSIDEYFDVLLKIAMDDTNQKDIAAINEGLMQILPYVSTDWIKKYVVTRLECSILKDIDKLGTVHTVLAHMITRFSYSEGRMILDRLIQQANQMNIEAKSDLVHDSAASLKTSYIVSSLLLNMRKLLHIRTMRAQSPYPEVLTDIILDYVDPPRVGLL